MKKLFAHACDSRTGWRFRRNAPYLPGRPALAVLIATCLVTGCSPDTQSRRESPPKESNELRVLCGSSMAGPAQAVGELFRTNHRVQVTFDLGGSETLLPKVLAGVPADIFICHDPFEQKLKESGHWAGSAVVGVLEPVLLVRPGNPQNIQSISDLARPNLKIGIGDPRYSTCGEMFVKLLEEKGIHDQVMKQVVLQGRAHAEIANGLLLGPLDVVVVWNFVARLYAGKVQILPTAERYPEVKVTIVGLKPGASPAQRDAFLRFCRSEHVKTIFAENGYVAGR